MAAPQRGHAHVAGLVRGQGAVRWRGDRRWRCGEQRAREGHAGRATGVRQKSRLANADEAARQDVLDEAAEKLHRRERHRALLAAMRVVLPVKRHALAVEGEQSVIADRHAMGVAPEVAQHRGRAAEGRLGVDDPVRVEEGVDEGMPLRRVAQELAAPGEIEFVPVVRAA